MRTRHRIALLTAGLLIGAQLGIAAIGVPIPDASEQMEPTPGEAQALESGIAGETTEAQVGAPATPDGSTQSPIAEVERPILPVRPRYEEPQDTAFPPSTDDRPMLPSLAAYLDSTEHLRVTGASGDVFPSSSDEFRVLPALAAYLEQREATLIAAETQPQVASAATATGENLAAATSQTAVAIPEAQEPARDISIVDVASPPSLGNPL